MVPSYKFAFVRLAPDDARDERINVGVLVFSEIGLDVRWGRRLEKIHALSAALDASTIRQVVEGFILLDSHMRDQGIVDIDDRIESLKRIGPICLSAAGEFEAASISAYEDRVSSIMKYLVDPQPAPLHTREKRSKL